MDTSWDPPPTAALPRDLEAFVAGVGGYAERGAPRLHRGLPAPTLTLVLPLDEPLATAPTHEDWSERRLDAQWLVLGGLHTRAAYVDNPGRWRGIQVDLSPLGSRRLFGVPAAALPTSGWDARELLGDSQDRLVDGLQTATSWAGRYDVLFAFLRARLARGHSRVRPEVVRAWSLVCRSNGGVRVADLADEVGYSRRRLTSLFTAELGISPTTAGRVARFDAARRRVGERAARGEPLDLAGVAAGLGYADHSHLVRDFREFAGLSPTRWLRAEGSEAGAGADGVQDVPDVQATRAAHRAA